MTPIKNEAASAPAATRRHWTKPEILSKSDANTAQYGGNPIAIDHFPAVNPNGILAS